MKIPFPCAGIEVSNDLESHRKDFTSIKTKMINNLNLAMQIVTCLRTEGISLECILNSYYFSDTAYPSFVGMRELV